MNQILILVSIFATSVFGGLTLIIGYIFLKKITKGRMKDYGMKIWYALILFSIGGALNTYQALTGVDSILNFKLEYFEFVFYSAYYIVLLFAIFSLYQMSKFMGFQQKSKEMVQAMKEKKGVNEDDGR